MKYLVISDIHGSLSGATTLQEAFHLHNPDYILCLGDILYHGPRNDLPEDYAPKKVIEIMNAYTNHIIAVRGNCDGEVDQMVLDFPITADYNMIPCENYKICMSHGHVYGPENLPKLKENDIFLSGHTHIPTNDIKDGIRLLNPGSISLPKGGFPATYAILEDHTFTHYTTDHKTFKL